MATILSPAIGVDFCAQSSAGERCNHPLEIGSPGGWPAGLVTPGEVGGAEFECIIVLQGEGENTIGKAGWQA